MGFYGKLCDFTVKTGFYRRIFVILREITGFYGIFILVSYGR